MEKKRLQLYWWDGEPNMGDAFNVALCRKLMGQAPEHADPETCEAAFCGSLLDDFLFGKAWPLGGRQSGSERIVHIWGSGFIASKWDCARGLRKFLPEVYCRRAEVHAVRGKLSLKRLEKIVGRDLSGTVLADPGLLASLFVEGNVRKEYAVGIIPHHAERDMDIYAKFNYPKQIFIDVRRDPVFCIREIAKCAVILSSSLHGLIFADSLGIPNARIVASDRLKGGTYKFKDYYSAYKYSVGGVSLDIRSGALPDLAWVCDHYRMDRTEIERKKRELLDSFPYPLIS